MLCKFMLAIKIYPTDICKVSCFRFPSRVLAEMFNSILFSYSQGRASWSLLKHFDDATWPQNSKIRLCDKMYSYSRSSIFIPPLKFLFSQGKTLALCAVLAFCGINVSVFTSSNEKRKTERTTDHRQDSLFPPFQNTAFCKTQANTSAWNLLKQYRSIILKDMQRPGYEEKYTVSILDDVFVYDNIWMNSIFMTVVGQI